MEAAGSLVDVIRATGDEKAVLCWSRGRAGGQEENEQIPKAFPAAEQRFSGCCSSQLCTHEAP